MMEIPQLLARLRHDFQNAGLEAPEIICLKTYEEGMRFLSLLPENYKSNLALNIPFSNMANNYYQLEIMGIFIKWPAK